VVEAVRVGADKAAVARVGAVKVAAVRAAATNPDLAQTVTVFAQVVGIKSRTWLVSAALTEPVPSAGRR